MKKVIAVVAALAWTIAPANADVYVKVDANGNAIGDAIVCEQSVCGDPNSDVSKALLKEGERFALQGYGTVGIGANNPDTKLKVDTETEVWTVTTPTSVSVFTPTTQETPILILPVTPVITDTATVLSDTATATVDTATATSTSTTFELLYAQVMALLTQILALIAKLNG